MALFGARLALAVLLAVALHGKARAGGCPEFTEAAGISEEQFYDLRASRSIEGRPDAPDLRGGDGPVRAYLAVPSAPDEAGPRGLAYYVSTDEALCLYYWTSDGYARAFRLATDEAALQTLVDETLRAVSHGAAPLERRARLRGEAGDDMDDDAPDGRESVSRSAAPLARPDKENKPPAPGPLLRRLSDALFPEEIRDGIGSLASLTVVPALNIGIVPFSGLDPDGDGSPLVETTKINVEAALRDVLAGRIYGIGGGVEPQSITGDPDATADPEWIFPRLPGAAREARAIAGRFGTVAVIGSDATVAEVAPKMAAAQYVHVAAHGFSDPRDPIDGSFLALTGGRLTAREIQAMQFAHSPLVVLSACQTGLGGTLRAGIVGLARAFLFAGSSSVVASLWNVDDEATAWIMSRFAENIARHPPAEALRLAQQAARTKWPDPKTWAAFIVFGSRTVSFAADPSGEPALAPGLRLPVEAEFRLSRSNGSERLDLSKRHVADPGDAIYMRASNGSDRPVDVSVLYIDVHGEPASLGDFRLQPGEVFDSGLAGLTDGSSGYERLVAVFTETDRMSPLQLPPDLDGLLPLASALTLVGPDAMGGLLPARGITPLLDLGPQRGDGLLQAPLDRGEGRDMLRRALGVVSLDVQRRD